jgi:hypothetical protein
VQGYYSAADHKCVIPEAYSTIWKYNGAPYNWSAISQGVRQIYAGFYKGRPTLVATDSSGNVWLYTGSPATWSVIGGVGCAMLAIVDDSIFCLAQNTNTLVRYTGTGWTLPVGLPDLWMSGIYGGGSKLIGTDSIGEAWSFSIASGSWSFIAGNSNAVYAVAANDTDVYLATMTLASTLTFRNNQLINLGSGVADLFGSGGPNDMLAVPVNAIAGDRSVWDTLQTYTASTGFILVAPPPVLGRDSFAVGGSALFGLSGDHTVIAQCNNPHITYGGWTNIGGPSPRLVGQGDTIYAAGSVVY